MKNNKILDLIIKILFIVIFIISLYFIISGLNTKEDKKKDNNEILETDLIVDPFNVKIDVGEECELKVTVIPSNATNKNVNWEVGDSSIISLERGKVVGLKPGNTYIKVTTERKKIERTIYVEVTKKDILVEEIKVKEANIKLAIGERKKIEYEIIPEDATNKKISFSTDNKDIVSFDANGNVVAIKEGKANVILKSSNEITAIISVTVSSPTKNKTALFVGDSITYG